MSADPSSFVLADARLILADRVVETGWLAVVDGRIAEIGEGRPPEAALSMGGDTLIPGLVELHTDHLEVHEQPRPKVYWPPMSAVLSYDAQVASAGMTTVFDCLRVGGDNENIDPEGARAHRLAKTLSKAAEQGLLRSEHRTHLRCEVCTEDVLAVAQSMLSHYTVALVSLMDHTPGIRQFRNKEKLREYYRGKTGMSERELDAFFAERIELHERLAVVNRRRLVDMARTAGITIASHDDTTLEHVAESRADGAAIAEFPTTLEAAEASHAAGIAVMMGAPNLIRGGSHSGNVAAEDLARAGTLDIFSSDYVPASMIQAAFELPQRVPAISLPQAIATVTRNPALSAGLPDRGELTPGLRADLVRVCEADVPVVRTVWREGRRVI